MSKLQETYAILRRPHVVFIDENASEVALHTRCFFCGKLTMFQLSREAVERWAGGAHVQDVWPELVDAHREALMSGICNACFDRMFPDE